MAVANQTEVPLSLYITTTLNTSIEHTSRQFIITFAVVDIKYNFLDPRSLKNIYRTSIFKTLHYNESINLKIN